MQDLARKHLDKRFDQMRSTSDFARPPRGWLRAVREALGMTAAQFGKRLQVSQSRVSALERAEVADSVTLASLRRAAEVLDCTLVYALVPRQPLHALLMARARAVAAKKLSRVNHTMRLENQEINAEELDADRERLALALAEHPRRLWDDV